MELAAHREWTEDAWRLIRQWAVPGGAPCIETPIQSRWESDDGRETTTTLMWSGDLFETGWDSYIYGAVRDACVSDRGVWKWQWPAYQESIRRFFGNRGSPAVVNLILVTPTRVPRFLWKFQGRPTMHEYMIPNPSWVAKADKARAISIPGLSFELKVPLSEMVWWGRRDVSRRDLRLAQVEIRRWCQDGPKHYRINMGRAFEANPELDADAFVSGTVPVMQDLMSGSGLTTRTHAPMIQFVRLDRFGQIDLLMFETSRDSGQLVDIRWARQPFDSFVVLDPYFGTAILDALARGRPLINR